jgi:hypothetical protein
MGMILSEKPDYYVEIDKVQSSVAVVKGLKRIGNFLITFSPIMWILFFGLLAVVVNLAS